MTTDFELVKIALDELFVVDETSSNAKTELVGFEKLRADDDVALQLSSVEEKRALGKYLTLIGRLPKLNPHSAIRVGRKKRRK